MRHTLPAAALSLCLAGLLTTGCANPPDKEMQQAQGAIDAARAAGADEYATDELRAATTALDRSRDAVTQRDYRLALSQALDSRERARNAARLAADEKAAVRVEVERSLSALEAAVQAARDQLKAAAALKLPPSATESARSALALAQSNMQKARASTDRREYLAARAQLRGLLERLQEARAGLEAAIAQRQSQAARRPR
jgi:colicin import membrane protein